MKFYTFKLPKFLGGFVKAILNTFQKNWRSWRPWCWIRIHHPPPERIRIWRAAGTEQQAQHIYER